MILDKSPCNIVDNPKVNSYLALADLAVGSKAKQHMDTLPELQLRLTHSNAMRTDYKINTFASIPFFSKAPNKESIKESMDFLKPSQSSETVTKAFLDTLERRFSTKEVT